MNGWLALSKFCPPFFSGLNGYVISTSIHRELHCLPEFCSLVEGASFLFLTAGASGSKPRVLPGGDLPRVSVWLASSHTESPRCQKSPAFYADGKALGHNSSLANWGPLVRLAGPGGRASLQPRRRAQGRWKAAMMSQTGSLRQEGLGLLQMRRPDLTVTCWHRAGLRNPQSPELCPPLGEPLSCWLLLLDPLLLLLF